MNRTYKAKQVYLCGKINLCREKNVIFMLNKRRVWVLVALPDCIDMASQRYGEENVVFWLNSDSSDFFPFFLTFSATFRRMFRFDFDVSESADKPVDPLTPLTSTTQPSVECRLLDFSKRNRDDIDKGQFVCECLGNAEYFYIPSRSLSHVSARYPELEHSDLLPGNYEGGFKVWECTWDLIKYLTDINFDFSGKKVIDVGCGQGLCGIHALETADLVLFQDFNESVLEFATYPTVAVNRCGSALTKAMFVSGSWLRFLCFLDERNLLRTFDVLLTSETVYEKSSVKDLASVVSKSVRAGGVAFVAAKAYYFGVGGSPKDLRRALEDLKVSFAWEEVFHTTDGVQRVVIKIQMSLSLEVVRDIEREFSNRLASACCEKSLSEENDFLTLFTNVLLRIVFSVFVETRGCALKNTIENTVHVNQTESDESDTEVLCSVPVITKKPSLARKHRASGNPHLRTPVKNSSAALNSQNEAVRRSPRLMTSPVVSSRVCKDQLDPVRRIFPVNISGDDESDASPGVFQSRNKKLRIDKETGTRRPGKTAHGCRECEEYLANESLTPNSFAKRLKKLCKHKATDFNVAKRINHDMSF
ncbi:unnamed protein product [Notodromas monacha]|uniref:protein-histidine N-methyltransferase n=1 Tax=Notodromas monacha TaxID=399045 RepID=A0A7R9GEB2_9CRUS|nr:unnamed protein product [Notodromas monacha]CAG0918082.1 unnamed protein product [Notodromas monacha]